jgi:hypothetical protein
LTDIQKGDTIAAGGIRWENASGLAEGPHCGLTGGKQSSNDRARIKAVISGGPIMEKSKSDPIVIEQAGMRMTVAHRHGLGGTDEGLTFDITTAGPENEGKRILRFDCFYKNPHYHVGASGEQASRKMKDQGIEDPVRWSLEQLKTRFPAMIREAGYEEIAGKIDQQVIADQLTRLEPEILAKY